MRELKRLFDPRGAAQPRCAARRRPDAHLRAPQGRARRSRRRSTAASSAATASRSARPRTSPSPPAAHRRCAGNRARAAAGRRRRRCARELERDYDYAGVDSCAVDGMCAHRLPGRHQHRRAGQAAARASAPARADRGRLDGRPRALGRDDHGRRVGALTAAARRARRRCRRRHRGRRARCSAPTRVPQWTPRPARAAGVAPAGRARRRAGRRSVYFAACVGSHVRPGGRRRRRSGVRVPATSATARACTLARARTASTDLCCGTPVVVQGLRRRSRRDMARTGPAAPLRTATDGGRLPVVCDASSCTEGFRRRLRRRARRGVDRRRGASSPTASCRRASGRSDRLELARPAPDLLVHAAGPRPGAAGRRRGRRRRPSPCPTTGGAAPSRATAGCCTPS